MLKSEHAIHLKHLINTVKRLKVQNLKYYKKYEYCFRLKNSKLTPCAEQSY